MLTELTTPESLEVQVSVVQQAFETLAEMPVMLEEHADKSTVAEGTVFVACLRYLGECSGSVRLECSPEVAFAFTRRVISESQPSSLDGDVRDAVGELVNTIGGNLKGLLPAGVRLSTPKVSGERAYDQSTPNCLSCLVFKSPFGSFRLLLLNGLTG